MYLSSPRSLAGQRGGAGFDRLEPGEGVVGGEGGVGENGEQAKADLLVYLARRERVGGGRSAAEGTRRRGAPVALGGEGRVGEHRWECGMLVGGLIWAEEDCRGGSAASFELVGARVGGGAVPVGIERVGGVVELRGAKAELLVWSARAEEPQRGGPTAASSSPAFWVERRRVLWRGSKEKAKGGEE